MHVKYEKLILNEPSLFLYKEFNQQQFNSPYHWHDEFELIYIKAGQGKLLVGNQALNFKEGELYLFAPGLNHVFYNLPEKKVKKKNAHAIVIQFLHQFLGLEFWKSTETNKINHLLQKSEQGILFPTLPSDTVNQFCQIGKLKDIKRLTSLLEMLESLSQNKKMKSLHAGTKSAMPDKSDSIIIANVFKYVAENFQKDVSFNKAASVANMQRAAFCRFFKRKTQKKFSAFVNEIRIAHARKLLVESDMSVIEICYECGFESLSYFNRQFKLLTTLSPREFKNKMIEPSRMK